MKEAPAAANVRDWLAGKPLSARLHLIVGLILPSALACFNMLRLRSLTVDDAFISFRYARNFARGWGLVYNQGEPIEGYTNFLWTVMLGLGAKLGLDPEPTSKVLGAGFALGALAALYFLAQKLRPLKLMPCIATWLAASTTVFTGYAVFGLETAMFSCLVLLGTLMMVGEEERGSGFPWSALPFAAAALTRPEAPLYLGLLMLFLAGRGLVPLERWIKPREEPAEPREGEAQGDAELREEDAESAGGDAEPHEDAESPAGDAAPEAHVDVRRERSNMLFVALALVVVGAVAWLSAGPKASVWLVRGCQALIGLALLALLALLPRRLLGKRNLLRGVLFVVPPALHIAWRHSYYGSWLPNTLGAKTGNLQQQFHGGAAYLEKCLRHEGVVIYLALFGLAAAFLWRHRLALALAMIVVMGSFYVVIVGGDWMPLYRFMVPILPFFYLLVGLGVRELLELRQPLVTVGVALFALIALGQRGYALQHDRQATVFRERNFWLNAAGKTADWFLAEAEQRGRAEVEGAIALGDIGRIGYVTDMPILDLLGLVDPVIAKLPGGYTNKTGPGYRDRFFDVQPRYFVLISGDNDCRHPSVPGSRALYYDKRFRKMYRLSGRTKLDRGFSWCIYEHADHHGHAVQPLPPKKGLRGKGSRLPRTRPLMMPKKSKPAQRQPRK